MSPMFGTKAISHTVTPQDTCNQPSLCNQTRAPMNNGSPRKYQIIQIKGRTASERQDSLRAAFVNLCVPLRPLGGPVAVIMTGPVLVF